MELRLSLAWTTFPETLKHNKPMKLRKHQFGPGFMGTERQFFKFDKKNIIVFFIKKNI